MQRTPPEDGKILIFIHLLKIIGIFLNTLHYHKVVLGSLCHAFLIRISFESLHYLYSTKNISSFICIGEAIPWRRNETED